MSATITVTGAWATLHHVSTEHLEDCLALDDPKRWYNRAYRDGRWDGKVRLYTGRQFPAGLTAHVTAHLASRGIDVHVADDVPLADLDLTRFDAMYFGVLNPDTGEGLWPHQVAAVRALLQTTRGILKAATGSGKTECIAAVTKLLWEERGWRSIVMVPSTDILSQTVDRFRRRYHGHPSVGQYGAGVKEVGDVIVGTAQTLVGFKPRTRKVRNKRRRQYLAADPVLRRVIAEYEVLAIDEAHHTSSETWFEIATQSGAVCRYGVSGTPDKDQLIADMRLIGATGPIVHDVAATELIDAGLASKPKIVMVMADAASGPALPTTWVRRYNRETGEMERRPRPVPYAAGYDRGVVHNSVLNRAIVRAATWFVDAGRRTLMICRRREHWEILRDLLADTGVDFHALWGDTEQAVRDEAKRQLQAGQTQCVLATTIWDEGTDVPAIGALVLAEGVRASTVARQRIGRGMRRIGGTEDLWVADFIPTCHPKLMEHGLERCKAYEGEGYEVLTQFTWPPDDDVTTPLFPFATWDRAYAAFQRASA